MDPLERFYPESRFGGFSNVDGTISFYSRVQALVSPDANVLDVGCGRGVDLVEDSVQYRRNLRSLRGRCRQVIGLDVDLQARSNPGVDRFCLVGKGQPWPLSDRSIDLVLADFVLEHLRDPEEFLEEASRVLKRGGVFCARTTNRIGYIGLLGTLIPNRWHARIVAKAQSNRREIDVFPTVYRINTVWTVRKGLRKAGLQGIAYGWSAEPTYLRFSSLLYRVGRFVHSVTPHVLAGALFIFARRTE